MKKLQRFFIASLVVVGTLNACKVVESSKDNPLISSDSEESGHLLDRLGTTKAPNIREGEPSFNCFQVSLSDVRKTICNSWQLSYLERNFNFIYEVR